MKYTTHINKVYLFAILSSLACSTNTIANHTIFFPAFDDAMTVDALFTHLYTNLFEDATTANDISFLKDNYAKHIQTISHSITIPNTSERIPKIIHQIWLGPNKKPQGCEKWHQTWLEAHPTWQYRLWTDADLASFGLMNQDSFNTAENYAEMADILRYEIIYRYGGVYVDIDFECLQPFDFLHECTDFYAGIHDLYRLKSRPGKNKLAFNNALFGARPGHPILEAVVYDMKNHKGKEQLERNGVFYFTNKIKDIAPTLTDVCLLLPQNFLYSWGPKPDGPYTWLQKEALAIHHYIATWK